MKRLLPILLLVGCSSAVTNEGTSTLAPLPTTGIPTIDTIPSDPEMDDVSLLEYGDLWCQLMEDGMGDTDVVERINEGATDDADRGTHFAIVLAGIRNLCPSQLGKAEYISLNAPLP
jgi:hypothetical protein